MFGITNKTVYLCTHYGFITEQRYKIITKIGNKPIGKFQRRQYEKNSIYQSPITTGHHNRPHRA